MNSTEGPRRSASAGLGDFRDEIENAMKFSPRQHLKMASLLNGRATKNPDPERAKKQKALAKVFRLLARKSYERKPDANDSVPKTW
jgi:hypothetical protein